MLAQHYLGAVHRVVVVLLLQVARHKGVEAVAIHTERRAGDGDKGHFGVLGLALHGAHHQRVQHGAHVAAPAAIRREEVQLRPADLRRSADPDAWQILCANRWARAALQAAALHSDLACRAERLAQAAPRLRARDAAATVAALLSEDALAPRAGLHANDRAARRLFERLTALGLVRELSGRAQFRIYGL